MSVPKTNENSNSPNLRKPSLTPSIYCFRQPSQAAKIHVEVDLDRIKGTSNYAHCIFRNKPKTNGKENETYEQRLLMRDLLTSSIN